jgi:hypothetical protein
VGMQENAGDCFKQTSELRARFMTAPVNLQFDGTLPHVS